MRNTLSTLVDQQISQQRGTISKLTSFLIVDDFEPLRKVTAGQLRSMGALNIITARNGAKALRMLGKQWVDIVLSDWNIPIMTGLELLKAGHADGKLSQLPSS